MERERDFLFILVFCTVKPDVSSSIGAVKQALEPAR